MDANPHATATEPQTAEQDWQVIGKLYDRLIADSDPWCGIQAGLEYLVSLSGATAAALYFPPSASQLAPTWTFIHLPLREQENLLQMQAPFAAWIETVVATRSVFLGDDTYNLAGIFPLVVHEQVTGALLVFGPAIGAQARQRWLSSLHPVARVLELYLQQEKKNQQSPSQAELINSRNTLRALFDSLPISIYIIDSSYRLVAVNNSRAERAGKPPKALVGGSCFEKLHQRASPCQGCQVSATFETGKSTTRLLRDWLEHDTFVEWEINTFPIQAETELPTQSIVVEADVTEKRNLEANLIQSEKLAAVGQLAAGVAHEINNPLTAIIANIQLLQREIDPGEVDLLDSVKLIETASTRAQQVVRNLLSIARKEKYQFEPLDLNETLQNALALVEHELVDRPIQVELDLAEPMPLLIGSQDHLQGVWINLLLNAIDAIDKDRGKITISSCFTGNRFQVVIQDNGMGIRPEFRERVFEPFFTTKSSGRGTGLGLSLCLRVIRQHGGNILVDSEPGQWTRFTITLANT